MAMSFSAKEQQCLCIAHMLEIRSEMVGVQKVFFDSGLHFDSCMWLGVGSIRIRIRIFFVQS